MDCFRNDSGLGFTAIAVATSSHRHRKRKARHPLAGGTELPERSGMSPRGSRRGAWMPSGRTRACHLCLAFPTRMGDASMQRGFDRVEGKRVCPRWGSWPCSRPRKPAQTLKSFHFHSALSAHPQVPVPRPLPRRDRHWVESPGPAHSGSAAKHNPALLATYCGVRRATIPSAEPAPTRLLQRTRAEWTPSAIRSHIGHRVGKTRQPAPHTHCLPLGLLSPACTVSERSCPGTAVLGNSFNFLALRFKPPELAASSSARSRPRFKGRLKPPLPPPPPPPVPPLTPVPPWWWWWE